MIIKRGADFRPGYEFRKRFHNVLYQEPWSLTDSNLRIFNERTTFTEGFCIEQKRWSITPDMTKQTVRYDYYILILLLYHVFTTGSTLHACFVASRSVFPPSVRISVATLGLWEGDNLWDYRSSRQWHPPVIPGSIEQLKTGTQPKERMPIIS